MNKYEVLYILNASIDDAAKEELIEKFKAIVTNAGGEVEGVDKWGVKKLAYEINYLSEGYYILVKFTSGPEFPAELDRVLGITDGVIRSLITLRAE